MEIFAHRGLLEPGNPRIENSMRALAAAVDAGYWIETDVRRGRDREILVFHDADLRRVLGDDRRTADVSAEDLRRLYEARSGLEEPDAAALRSLLGWPALRAATSSGGALVDVKQPDDLDFVLDVCGEIARAKCQSSTWLFDMDQELIPGVKQAHPDVRLLARISHLEGESVEDVVRLGAAVDGLWFDDYHGDLLGGRVERMASRLDLPMFFVSPELHPDTHPLGESGFEEAWKAVLRNPAFTGICTDFPERLRDCLGRARANG